MLKPHDLNNQHRNLPEANVIIIPSDPSDMTGHADGMVRFVNENTVVGNGTKYKLESDIKDILKEHTIKIVDLPYVEQKKKDDPEGISAKGCNVNYLETSSYIFLPVSGYEKEDTETISIMAELFKDRKTIIPTIVDHIQ